MPLRLKALYADVVLPLHDTKVVLGRSRQCQITATTVSRHACTAVPNRDGSVQLTAGKAVYVQRKGSRAIYAVQREDTCVVCLECQQVQSSEKVSAATAATESLTEDAQAVLHAQGCFKDKHIVFWLSAHIALLRQKAAQAGAVLEDSITAQTSLVIAAKDTTASEAASHLTALPACLPYKSKKFEGQKLKLPSKISFVVPQYISDCLAQNSLIPTAPYQITLQQIATQDTRTYSQETYKSTGNDSVQRSTAAQGPSEEQHPTSADVTDLTRPQISSTEAVLTPSSKRQKLADEGGPGLQQGAVKDTPSIGTPDKKIGIYLDIDPKQLSFTGGSTGIVWGTGIDRTAECGVWEEPWEQESALNTIRKIERHWHQLDNSNASQIQLQSPADDAQAPAEGGSDDEEEAAAQRQHHTGAGVNRLCNHIACSAQPFCLVEQLQTVRDNYRGRVDQFRIKAVERAISEIVGLTWPLRKDTDVAQLTMGAKSKDKVIEILQTGTLRRNEAMADDEHQQVIQLFLKVWGAAEATCERWYAAGCRTLDDLRARTDLSEQQVAGLKHFDNMQQRISRPEVELVHGLVYKAVSELLKVEGQADADRLHCRVTGSYIRGKPMTGDIDFLILPPPSRNTLPCGQLLQALLSQLLQQGLLLDEMSPERPRPRDSGSATWLGLCKPPGSPFVRRIDFKVYPSKYIAFAVNYFIGSGPFVRALRYWANTATAKLAQQVAPSANGFKLTDTVLVPMIRQPKQRTAARQVKSVDIIVPPGVDCIDETQIFEALGLAYVPPYMRYFGTNYQ